MSIFDIEQYLDSSTSEAAQKRENLNPALDYFWDITEVKARQNQGKKDPTQQYLFFDYTLVCDLNQHPEEHARIGVDKITVKYTAGVDHIPGTGALDWSKGKNNGLRILREAVGQNNPGESWNPRMPVGRRVRGKVKLREYPEGSGNLIEEIGSIAKIG